jgi:glycosyltransferase involved in cell wall biosynthesis
MKKLVIIGTVFPEPNSTAAGLRMMQLINLFQEMEYEITFLSTAKTSDFSENLEQYEIKTFQVEMNNNSFDELLKSINPSIVLFDRFITEEQFGWRVAEICPEAMTILETVDLHFLRKARENSFKKDGNLDNIELISDIFKREMASILRCDLSLIISEFEMELLTETFYINTSILYYLPLFAPPISDENKNYSEREHFVSIGNFLHEPNWQTVLQLKKIWLNIKSKLPKAELHIYGAYLPEKAKQLHNEKEGFLIKGRAESVEEVFKNSRILLAPIPFGAGIKGKLLDAMQYGLPSITSTIGAEGMHGNLPWNGFVEDDLKVFVEKSVALYSDENLWKNAQNNANKILEKRFSKALFKEEFVEKINHLSENLEKHRKENFLGQILQHHSLKSTKYMSKWIEEKNKS